MRTSWPRRAEHGCGPCAICSATPIALGVGCFNWWTTCPSASPGTRVGPTRTSASPCFGVQRHIFSPQARQPRCGGFLRNSTSTMIRRVCSRCGWNNHHASAPRPRRPQAASSPRSRSASAALVERRTLARSRPVGIGPPLTKRARMADAIAPASPGLCPARVRVANEIALMPGNSYLETRSVSRPVGEDYYRKFWETCQWTRRVKWSIRSTHVVDMALTAYLGDPFFQG